MNKFVLKFTLGFAVLGYLLPVGLNFAPVKWHPSPALVFVLCPSALLTITVDPKFMTVLILLAPLNAIVYGTLGFFVGLTVSELRSEHKWL